MPPYSPRDPGSELLLPEDEIMLSDRAFLEDFRRRGWLIDTAAQAELGQRRVLSVPSPGRQQSRNWVTATVPLVGAAPATSPA